MTVPTYRYLLCDLLTDRLLADLPLTGVSFSGSISRTGTLSATLTAPNAALIRYARTLYTYTGRSALWVERRTNGGSSLWWGGIPWTVQPQQDQQGAVSLQVSASTFDSYAGRRLLYEDKVYTQVGQNLIIKDLWDTIQADARNGYAAGNIGVDTSQVTTPGTLRNAGYLASDGSWVRDLIEQIGDLDGGPEHTIRVYYDADGSRRKQLVVADRIGITEPRWVFDRVESEHGFGGNILSWQHSADATAGGTAAIARGSTPTGAADQELQPMMSDRAFADDLIADGWPLLDLLDDHPDATVKATLDSYATGLIKTSAGAVPTSSYTVRVDNGWSPGHLGDAVRLMISDTWHGRQSLVVRPVAYSVTAAEAGQPETVTLSFTEEDS